jgi:hypothetical protein
LIARLHGSPPSPHWPPSSSALDGADVSTRPSALPSAQSAIKLHPTPVNGLTYSSIPIRLPLLSSHIICHTTTRSGTTITGATTECSAVPPVSSGSASAPSSRTHGCATTATLTTAKLAASVAHASSAASSGSARVPLLHHLHLPAQPLLTTASGGRPESGTPRSKAQATAPVQAHQIPART